VEFSEVRTAPVQHLQRIALTLTRLHAKDTRLAVATR
jgi:hypothetical protein